MPIMLFEIQIPFAFHQYLDDISVLLMYVTGWFFRWKFMSSPMMADVSVSVQMCGVGYKTSERCPD